MKTTSALAAFLVVASSTTSTAFTAPATRSVTFQQKSTLLTPAFLADKTKEEIAAESVFMPPAEAGEDEEEEEDEDVLDQVEKFGKGAAKVSHIFSREKYSRCEFCSRYYEQFMFENVTIQSHRHFVCINNSRLNEASARVEGHPAKLRSQPLP